MRSCTWMDDQKINPKRSKQRHHPKQIQTHNSPTDHEENINSTNKGRDLILTNKPWIVRWGAENMPQNIQWHSRFTLDWSTHPKWEKDQKGNTCYGLDWLQNGVWSVFAKVDTKLTQNIQNITWSPKLYRENHENLVSRIDSRREKLSWRKNLKRYISRRCTITVTIPNCPDAT